MNRRVRPYWPLVVVGLVLGVVVSTGWAGSPAGAEPPAVPPGAPPGGSSATPASVWGDDVDVDKIPSSKATPPSGGGGGGPVWYPATPPTRGEAVVHPFDVVVAHLFPSPEVVPPEPVETLGEDSIDALLARAATWWSDNTDLAFDFNTDTRYATINTTCAAIEEDAFAAMDEPFDRSVYTDSGRDLMILQAEGSCGSYAGVAMTVSPTGNLFAGGVFQVVPGAWDGAPEGPDLDHLALVAAHEFGHTVGMSHANVLDCASAALPGADRIGPLWDGYGQVTCSSMEYGDYSSIMGTNHAWSATLNSPQRVYLGVGWDDVMVINRPVTRQVVTLARYDLPSPAAPIGVVAIAPDGGALASLEYRPADDNLFGRPGVYVRDAPFPLKTELVEPLGLPRAATQDRALRVPLDPGETYVSRDGTILLRTISVDATTATVEVTVTDEPGLTGMAYITQQGGELFAQLARDASAGPADAAYQWFRNGQPIPGATDKSYTPTLPDSDAVYRVEITLTADGHTPTTHTSRGIMPDDHRFWADGSELWTAMVDENGVPVDCAGLPLDIRISTPGGRFLGQGSVTMGATARYGTCRATLDTPLTGPVVLTAAIAVVGQTPVPWQRLYWPPATAATELAGAGADAVLILSVLPQEVEGTNFKVSYYDPEGRPVLMAHAGGRPLGVVVAVTDAAGRPAVGVPVSLRTGLGDMIVAAENPVTDASGLVYATLDRDPASPPIAGCADGKLEAVVTGLPGVTGSPVSYRVCGAGSGLLSGSYAGEMRVPADGRSAIEMHVRAWDDKGKLIPDQAGRLEAKVDEALLGRPEDVHVGTPVWDAAQQDYVIRITSTTPLVADFKVTWDGAADTIIMAPVEFTEVFDGAVTLVLDTDHFTAIPDPCGGAARVMPESVGATVMVVDRAGKPVAGAPVSWSADVPFLLDPAAVSGVTGADGTLRITVRLDARAWQALSRDPAGNVVMVTGLIRAVSGAVEATASLPVWEASVLDLNPFGVWTITASPTVAGPVPADGVATWTVEVRGVDICGVPATNWAVEFRASGHAVVSASEVVTGPDGLARITVTDKVAESVDVSAVVRSASGQEWPVPGSPARLSFVPVSPGPPTPVEVVTGGTAVEPVASGAWTLLGGALLLTGGVVVLSSRRRRW